MSDGIITYQKLLLEEFELKRTRGFLNELAIGNLYTLPGTTGVIGRIDGLNSDHNRIVVFLGSDQILRSVESRVYHAHLLWELLLQTRREFVCIRIRKVWVCVEAK